MKRKQYIVPNIGIIAIIIESSLCAGSQPGADIQGNPTNNEGISGGTVKVPGRRIYA